MEWLNYHHLYYFWLVVKEGGVAKAAARLRLAHPTVSAQVHALEAALGEQLLSRQGRRLVLTEVGTVVYRYACDIFSLGTELLDTLQGRPTGQPLRLVVGIADVVPKLIARRLLEPARALEQEVVLSCREGKVERLVTALAQHEVDVVLSDTPLPSGSGVKAYSHLLGECGVTLFAAPSLAKTLRKRFPQSLDRAPVLLPTETATLRRELEQWFQKVKVRPRLAAEFDDSALLKVFGQDGAGFFPGPSAIETELCRQYEVQIVGRIAEVTERFFAISLERRLHHPAVVAVSEAARTKLFG
jgi:LysR family transcriptional activator of nhaA